MIPLTLQQIATALNAKLIPATAAEQLIESVSTDSRDIGTQGLFIALKGERFDAHEFAPTAVKNGAAALLVSR